MLRDACDVRGLEEIRISSALLCLRERTNIWNNYGDFNDALGQALSNYEMYDVFVDIHCYFDEDLKITT